MDARRCVNVISQARRCAQNVWCTLWQTAASTAQGQGYKLWPDKESYNGEWSRGACVCVCGYVCLSVCLSVPVLARGRCCSVIARFAVLIVCHALQSPFPASAHIRTIALTVALLPSNTHARERILLGIFQNGAYSCTPTNKHTLGLSQVCDMDKDALYLPIRTAMSVISPMARFLALPPSLPPSVPLSLSPSLPPPPPPLSLLLFSLACLLAPLPCCLCPYRMHVCRAQQLQPTQIISTIIIISHTQIESHTQIISTITSIAHTQVISHTQITYTNYTNHYHYISQHKLCPHTLRAHACRSMGTGYTRG